MDNTTYLIEEFVGTRLGKPYRLFPFGKIVKNGKVREVTPEIAAQFKLPHFKPAVKLGSHEEATPAGGHIVALEVREDGLYAVPEWNDKGTGALDDGAYRYHSPEVIWSDGAIENPKTGEMIPGPLILGDALLHSPHLGEDAALYSIQPHVKGDEIMSVETVEVPKTFWDKLSAVFNQPEPEEKPDPVKVEETEQYQAIVTERDDFKAKYDALIAEQEKQAVIEKYEGELKDANADPALAEILADLPEEKAEVLMRQLKASGEQAKQGDAEQELGTSAEGVDNPAAVFDAEVKRVMKEKEMNYAAATVIAAQEKPELYEAYQQANKKEK